MEQKLYLSINAAIKAGKEILNIYKKDFNIEYKADESPLTEADKASHNIIIDGLKPSGLPVLSEEGKTIEYDVRSEWGEFWLIDPLDGTKEFIKKNGEFTVNIALIKDFSPIMGVVYVPVTGVLYFASDAIGSFKADVSPETEEIDVESIMERAVSLNDCKYPEIYTIVASRSHSTPETEAFVAEKENEQGKVNLISAGSSIKLCLVAEKKANIYPRLAPTMEWDTAAGQAIAIFAGCKVYDYNTGKDLTYNKKNLLNPWFVVAG